MSSENPTNECPESLIDAKKEILYKLYDLSERIPDLHRDYSRDMSLEELECRYEMFRHYEAKLELKEMADKLILMMSYLIKGFIFDVTGDSTGDVTGDSTGDVAGDVTGDSTGDVTGDSNGDVTGDSTLNQGGYDIEDHTN